MNGSQTSLLKHICCWQIKSDITFKTHLLLTNQISWKSAQHQIKVRTWSNNIASGLAEHIFASETYGILRQTCVGRWS